MRVALAQIDSMVGDFQGNVERIRQAVEAARVRGAELVVCPELCVCGYPPMDLLDHASFVSANQDAVTQLVADLPAGVGVVVGHVARNASKRGKALWNVASLLTRGRVVGFQAKTLLPTYDVFDEARYFEPGRACRPIAFAGHKIGLTICEDIWWESDPDPGGAYARDPVRELADAGATVLLAPSASPYYMGKPAQRRGLLAHVARIAECPVIYVNAVGANDGLVFDGHSLAYSSAGTLTHISVGFAEDLSVVDTSADEAAITTEDRYGEVEAAIGYGIRDYLAKTGHRRVNLQISGGIDSAVVATVAARQLGADAVTGLALPSRFSSAASRRDAVDLVNNIGVRLHTVSIEPAFEALRRTLWPVFQGRPRDTTEENLQARVRGTLSMALANNSGGLALATGNKSEFATGYATLYGDMAGALAPIGDLWKTQVYALADRLNRDAPLIPRSTLTKPPSAELRPDQLDSDSLPPYEQLDDILERFVVESAGLEEIVTGGHPPALVRRVLRMVALSEHKRRQAPTVIKLSKRAFGPGRRFPIARYVEEMSASSSNSQTATGT